MAAANSTSRSSCFPVCVVNLPTTWLPRRLPRFESKMSRHGLRKRSAKPCYRYAEESLAVVSLRSWKQKPPNSLLIQDKTFYNLAHAPAQQGRPAGRDAQRLARGAPCAAGVVIPCAPPLAHRLFVALPARRQQAADGAQGTRARQHHPEPPQGQHHGLGLADMRQM